MGNSREEAFKSLWDILQYKDFACFVKEDGKWYIRMEYVVPTQETQNNFQKEL